MKAAFQGRRVHCYPGGDVLGESSTFTGEEVARLSLDQKQKRHPEECLIAVMAVGLGAARAAITEGMEPTRDTPAELVEPGAARTQGGSGKAWPQAVLY